MKINTDAAFRNGGAAIACVVRDFLGNIVLLATKVTSCSSTYAAELMAIDWACDFADHFAWRNLIWSSDALTVVKDINSTEEPRGWDTRYLILKCKNFLKPFSWKIV